MGIPPFPNLGIIQKSISHLYCKLGVDYIESFKTDFTPTASNTRYSGDGLIATQMLASDIVNHFRIPSTTVIVNYSSVLESPGRVELSSTNEVFVELQEKYRGIFNAVVGILSHEVAHIFLHKSSMEFSETLDNEILTDTTAALFGLGIAVLNATKEKVENQHNYSKTSYEHFGYLTPFEFGYVIAKRDYIHKSNSSKQIRLKKLKNAYSCGNKEHKRDLYQRPFRKRPFYQSIFYGNLFNSGTHLCDDIIFICPKCCRKLRITALHKTLTVKCAVCFSLYKCYS